MQQSIDVTHAYPLPWKIVNHFITAEKMKGGTDRRVTIRQEDDAFIWEYDVPMYLRAAIPAKVTWKDIVEINAEGNSRTERGTNVTWSERITLTELSVWLADDEDAMVTRYSKTIQLNMDLYWIPNWVKDTVIQQFKTASIQCRERETKAMVEEVERRGGIHVVLREIEEMEGTNSSDNDSKTVDIDETCMISC